MNTPPDAGTHDDPTPFTSSPAADDVTLIGRLRAALEGRYLVERHIGSGGMALVYLARDLRHDRRVALKLLRPDLSAVIGADRFLQEIRVAAHLQHPHLLPLFDSGEAGGLLYYVMPYVEGETLRDRMRRERQLSIGDTVKLASQVAAALDYAHRRGVVHRDVKPENILLHDGQALVADFGIALAIRNAGGTRITETGLSLGTPHYMSPEQASADRELDARTDVYALGAVIFEMLAGHPPHTGASAQAVVLKLMTETPRPLRELRPTVPAHVEEAVARALEKLPADRWQTAADLAQALERGPTTPTRSSAVSRPVGRSWLRLVPWIAATALVTAVTVVAFLGLPDRTPPRIIASNLLPPDGFEFSETESFGALSPDGRYFAFVTLGARGDTRLWVRPLDSLTARPVDNTDGAVSPFWSPDGEQLGFLANDELRVLTLRDGAIRQICPVADGIAGAWGAGGVIAIVAKSGIVAFDPGRKSCALAIPLDSVGAARFDLRHPTMLDDSRVIFTRSDMGGQSLAVGDLRTGQVRAIPATSVPGIDATFVPPNRLFVALWTGVVSHIAVVHFDARNVRATGAPIVLGRPVRTANAVAAYAASASGVLAYLPDLGDRGELLARRDGTVFDTSAATNAWTYQFARSQHVLLAASGSGETMDRVDVDRPTPVAVRLAPARAAADTLPWKVFSPAWSENDSLVAFAACRNARCGFAEGVIGRPESSGGLLVEPPAGTTLWPSSWTPDSRGIVYTRTAAYSVSGAQIWMYDRVARRSIPLVTQGSALEGAVSPDGRWLAYRASAARSARWQILVKPLSGSGEPTAVASAGGRLPRWRADGRELFFQTPDGEIMVCDVEWRSSGPKFSTPRRLFNASGWSRHNFFDIGTSYDVSYDGEIFALRMTPTDRAAVLLHDWRGVR